jgi:hypothetical protein
MFCSMQGNKGASSTSPMDRGFDDTDMDELISASSPESQETVFDSAAFFVHNSNIVHLTNTSVGCLPAADFNAGTQALGGASGVPLANERQVPPDHASSSTWLGVPHWLWVVAVVSAGAVLFEQCNAQITHILSGFALFFFLCDLGCPAASFRACNGALLWSCPCTLAAVKLSFSPWVAQGPTPDK